jgi:hypothetical protein
MEDDYNPHGKTKAVLDAAMAIVSDLPYTPTARYVFYRLLDVPGLHYRKKDYKKFLKTTSKARKRYYGEGTWNPTTLADDGRVPIRAPEGYRSVRDWIQSFADQEPYLDHLKLQDNIVEIWFEAAAMVGQFEHYTVGKRITLRAFKGDPSIPYKYEIATDLGILHDRYPDKKIVILYYGDFDPKGLTIPEDALKDIRAWCTANFDFIRVGINQDQIEPLELPEDPERPGCYQWEGIPDHHASALILDSIAQYWSDDVITEIRRREVRAGEIWNERTRDIIEELVDELEGDEEE